MKGVHYHRQRDRFIAHIRVKGERITLGTFKTEREAEAARQEAERPRTMPADHRRRIAIAVKTRHVQRRHEASLR